MSAKWTFWAWEQPIKSAPKKLALLQLANNANDDGKSWYSIVKMAVACGVSERTFQRSIKDLEADHLLCVERRSNRPSIYQLKDDEFEITLTNNGGDRESGIPKKSGDTLTGQGDRESPQGDRESHDLNSTPNTYPNSSNKDIAQKENCAALIEQGFDIFYSAGLVKKSKKSAFDKFRLLIKNMKANPIELGELLKSDIQARIANNQFGIDKLHPATYLNQQRWEDEHEKNDNGLNAQHGRKLGASERIAQRNAERYGSRECGLGMGENGGDIRRTVDQGKLGRTFENVDSSTEQAINAFDQDWDSTNS